MVTLEAHTLATRTAWCDRCASETSVEVDIVIVPSSTLALSAAPRFTGSVCLACDAVEVHR